MPNRPSNTDIARKQAATRKAAKVGRKKAKQAKELAKKKSEALKRRTQLFGDEKPPKLYFLRYFDGFFTGLETVSLSR